MARLKQGPLHAVYRKLEIVFIKNKCLPQLPKLTVLEQNPPIFNVLGKLEEKA
jgi:hypothetical protein